MQWLSPQNYNQHRTRIKSGDLLAWSGRSFAGRLVRVATASSWSHVGVAICLEGRVWVIEAREFSGVHIVPLSSYLDCAWLPLECEWDYSTTDYAVQKIGKVQYSFLKAIHAWYLTLANKTAPLKPDSTSHICSSFVSAILRKASVDIPDRLLTPGDLVNCCLMLGGSRNG